MTDDTGTVMNPFVLERKGESWEMKCIHPKEVPYQSAQPKRKCDWLSERTKMRLTLRERHPSTAAVPRHFLRWEFK